jgi:hypothetical protein
VAPRHTTAGYPAEPYPGGGHVTAAQPAPCPQLPDGEEQQPGECGTVTVELTEGPGAGTTITTDIPAGPGAITVATGDDVSLHYLQDDIEGKGQSYSVPDHQRSTEL